MSEMWREVDSRDHSGNNIMAGDRGQDRLVWKKHGPGFGVEETVNKVEGRGSETS